MNIVRLERITVHKQRKIFNKETKTSYILIQTLIYDREKESMSLYEQIGTETSTKIAEITGVGKDMGEFGDYGYRKWGYHPIYHVMKRFWNLKCVINAIQKTDWFYFSKLIVATTVGSVNREKDDNGLSNSHDAHDFEFIVKEILEETQSAERKKEREKDESI